MKKHLIGLCLLLVCVSAASAGAGADLYTGQIPVMTTQTKEREAVLGEALVQVLIKVSGNQGIETLPWVQALVPKAARYMQRYGYDKTEQSTGEVNKHYLLNASFDAKTIDDLLRQHGQAIWRTDRPNVLVWLLKIDAQGHQKLLSEDNSDLPAQMRFAAEQRGLTLMFPLMDLQDLSQISKEDVWYAKIAKLQAAAIRYAAKGMLIGRLQQHLNGQWQGQWQLVLDNQQLAWQTSGAEAADNMVTIVNDLADSLASRYAVLTTPGESQSVSLVVSGVYSLRTYAKLNQYLQALPIVESVSVQKISNREMVFNLSLRGGLPGLRQVMSRGHHLLPGDTDAIMASDNNTLYYKWQS